MRIVCSVVIDRRGTEAPGTAAVTAGSVNLNRLSGPQNGGYAMIGGSKP